MGVLEFRDSDMRFRRSVSTLRVSLHPTTSAWNAASSARRHSTRQHYRTKSDMALLGRSN
jgi:hypothetical protein